MITQEQKKRYGELLKENKVNYKKVDKEAKFINLGCIILGIVIGLSIFAVETWLEKKGNIVHGNTIVNLYVAILIFMIAVIIHIVIHESGHLVFGLLTGYKFLSFRIFSTIFYKKDGHIHKKKFTMKGTGGQCLMYPPQRQESGEFPYVLYNLGGGIANLLFSLPLIIPAILTDNINLRIVAIAFILAGVLSAALNLIPMSPGIQNDGMNLVSMLKDKNMEEAFYLQLKMNAEMSDGKEITEYAPEVFELPAGANDTNMLTSYIRLNAYYLQLTLHNYQNAEQILSEMLLKSGQYKAGILNAIELERLFLMVLNRRPVEEIASVYARCRVLLVNPKNNVSLQRVQYIYESLLSEEEKIDIMTLITKRVPKRWRETDHEKLYQEFLKTAVNYPVYGVAAMNVTIVEDIRKNYGINSNPVNEV